MCTSPEENEFNENRPACCADETCANRTDGGENMTEIEAE
jgi:hypothetical protein